MIRHHFARTRVWLGLIALLCIGVSMSAALEDLTITPDALQATSSPSNTPPGLEETAAPFVLTPQRDPTIAPFTPEYPCELQNESAIVNDGIGIICTSDVITERVVASTGETIFFIRSHYVASGCFSSISATSYQLRSCSREDGQVSTLISNLFGEQSWLSADGSSFVLVGYEDVLSNPHIYRVTMNTGDVLRLDQFPDCVVGAAILAWPSEEHVVEVRLWTGYAGDYRYYRLQDDGSGAMEVMQPIQRTPTSVPATPVYATDTPLPPGFPTPFLFPTATLPTAMLPTGIQLPTETLVPTSASCL